MIKIKAYLGQYITVWPKCAFFRFQNERGSLRPTIPMTLVLTFKRIFAIIESCKFGMVKGEIQTPISSKVRASGNTRALKMKEKENV
jgi:hypothetical protein